MPVIRTFALPDEAATGALAAALAPLLRPGDTVLLQGPLGAGKTSFARGVIRALCGPGTDVPSPSFNIVIPYDTPQGPLWHVDLYRVADPRELDELGLEDAFAEAIVLVEWPERLGARMPATALTLRFDLDGETMRRVTASGAAWSGRLAAWPRAAA